ncbi:histone-lysine N-methyltransferase SETMAR [Trichonephila clavipes]|nr:histone-lysine N-methyltransferase SETMAR [Trichonephila clavipes]
MSHIRRNCTKMIVVKARSLLSTTEPFEARDWPELANRRGIVFHQDNARPHTSVVIHQNLWELVWEVLMHPPYSPDLAPSDYRLFLALQNFLSGARMQRNSSTVMRFWKQWTTEGDVNDRHRLRMTVNDYSFLQAVDSTLVYSYRCTNVGIVNSLRFAAPLIACKCAFIQDPPHGKPSTDTSAMGS